MSEKEITVYVVRTGKDNYDMYRELPKLKDDSVAFPVVLTEGYVRDIAPRILNGSVMNFSQLLWESARDAHVLNTRINDIETILSWFNEE